MLGELYHREGIIIDFCEFYTETSNDGIPKQEKCDVKNCGVYVCLYGKCIAWQERVWFNNSIEDLTYARKIIKKNY